MLAVLDTEVMGLFRLRSVARFTDCAWIQAFHAEGTNRDRFPAIHGLGFAAEQSQFGEIAQASCARHVRKSHVRLLAPPRMRGRHGF